MINGVSFGANGAETWEIVDSARDDLTRYDAFVWHDSTTGFNHLADSLGEAVAFDAEQTKFLYALDAAEAAAGIQRKIRDESGAFRVWVRVG